ncbi:VOC family protein [Inquilinus limosus]|nr:VOC family protein [Inquilinus limosus]
MISHFQTENYIHHIALRVPNAEASRDWLMSLIGLRVDREFEHNGLSFIFMSFDNTKGIAIELIGGPTGSKPNALISAMEAAHKPGWSHICFSVQNVDAVIQRMRDNDQNILIDLMDGPPGSNVKKAAFVTDPWGNIFEFAEISEPS